MSVRYETPQLDVVALSDSDVVRTSQGGDQDGSFGPIVWPIDPNSLDAQARLG